MNLLLEHVIRKKEVLFYYLQHYSDDSYDSEYIYQKTQMKTIQLNYKLIFKRNKNSMINLLFKKKNERYKNFFQAWDFRNPS